MSDPIPPLRLDIPEVAEALRLSRAAVYQRIRRGEIVVQKDGARTFVTADELRAYVARLSARPAA